MKNNKAITFKHRLNEPMNKNIDTKSQVNADDLLIAQPFVDITASRDPKLESTQELKKLLDQPSGLLSYSQGILIGKLSQIDEDSKLWVQLPVAGSLPLPALTMCAIKQEHLGQDCAVQLLPNSNSAQAQVLIMGFILSAQAIAESLHLSVSNEQIQALDKQSSEPASLLQEMGFEENLNNDNNTNELLENNEEPEYDYLHIEAKQELILSCGESSIRMTADGVIEMRGNYISSDATALQRLRGGSVQVN
jgi:hypothetical protein